MTKPAGDGDGLVCDKGREDGTVACQHLAKRTVEVHILAAGTNAPAEVDLRGCRPNSGVHDFFPLDDAF